MSKLHWAVVWCLCAPVSALAFGPRVRTDDLDDPDVAIRNQSVHVDIHGRVATTTVEITYVNYANRQREARLRWRMAPDVAVHDLAMWVEGMRSPAALLTRVKAQAIYREIVEDQRDPALLQNLGGGLWSLRVFPIPAEGTQKVQIVFSQVLQARDGWVTYRGPAAVTPSTVTDAQDFEFSAVIRCPGGVKDIKAGAHNLGVQHGKDGAVTLGFREELADMSKSVSFSYRPARGAAGPVVSGSKTGRAYFAATVAPAEVLAKGKPHPRNIVLVIDTSASMKGVGAAAAIAGATEIVKRLKPADRFNVVLAGADARMWKDKLVAADKANIAAAIKLIAQSKAHGGTDLAAGLRAAESFNTEPGKPFVLYVFSDGMDMVGTGPATVPAKGQVKKGKADPKAAGLKPAPNVQIHWFEITTEEELSDAMAPNQVLFVWKIGSRQVLEESLTESLAIAGAHLITRITVTCKDAAGKLMPVGISELGANLPITICGPFDKAGEVTVTVSCRVDGKPASTTYRIVLPDPGKAHDNGPVAAAAMAKVWAHLEGERMFEALRRGKPAISALEALVAHSRKYRVLTRTTAFLVLEKDNDYLRRGIDRRVSFLPAGRTLDQRQTQLAKGGKRAIFAETVKKIARLRLRAKELRHLGRYAQAAKSLERIVRLDRSQFAACSEAALLREFLGLQRAMAPEAEAPEDDNGKPNRPWQEVLLRQKPVELIPAVGMKEVRFGKSVPTPPLINKKMRKILDTKIKNVDFKVTRLDKAIDFVREASGANIHVKWKTLKDEEIEKSARIENVKAAGVTVERLLRLLLDDVGGGLPLGFVVDEGVLVVSTKTDLTKQTTTRIYDVRDLVPIITGRWDRRVNHWSRDYYDDWGGGLFGDDDDDDDDDDGGRDNSGPEPSVRLPGSPAENVEGTTEGPQDQGVHLPADSVSWPVPARTRRPSGGGLFSDDDDDDDYEDYVDYREKYESDWDLGYKLISVIQRSVFPETWRWNSKIGNLTFFRSAMTIKQNFEGHLAIEKLLAKLRSSLKDSNNVPADISEMAEPFPEQMFTEDGHITPWVEQLLAAARTGKLSKFSSVRLVKVGRRRFARIGGLWFDVSLTRAARLYLVRRASAAAFSLLETTPDLEPCFRLGKSVIVAVDARTAVALDELGLSKTKSPDLKKIIKAFSHK